MLFTINHSKAIKKVLENVFNRFDISFELVSSSEIRIIYPISNEKLVQIKAVLSEYGIQLVEDPKDKLVARIKDLIHQMLHSVEKHPMIKTSVFLSQNLGYSYGYLSNLFSDAHLISIENYLILKKIELVKLMLIRDDISITEAN